MVSDNLKEEEIIDLRSLGLDHRHEDVLGVRELVLVEHVVFRSSSVPMIRSQISR